MLQRAARNPHVINISNPKKWADEYDQGHCLRHDPVVYEMERRFAAGEQAGFIFWDHYEWPLSKEQNRVIVRRRQWGLEYGCSVFANSQKKDFAFLISFAGRSTKPDARHESMTIPIIPQLLVTRKRLNMQVLVAALSEKEALVAAQMMCGKTNWQIAQSLEISEHTVKFHLRNIFDKLRVNNRQQAIAVLLAERYLSL